MMGRVVFFAALGLLLYILLSLAKKGIAAYRKEKNGGDKNVKKSRSIRMVECPVCRMHFPEDEAVLGDGVKYCSEACRQKARTGK